MIPKMDIALNDFSGGELNSDAKRMDKAALTGARVMSNWRILNSKKLKNRPGRRALFLESGRVDKVLMTPGNRFFIAFGAGTLRVYSTAGAQLFTQGGFAWTVNTAKNVVWCQDQSQKAIYIFFAGQQPQVLSWDGVSTWSVAAYAEQITSGNQKRTAFYRISPKGITMQPGACTGSTNIVFSSAIAVAGMVGTYFRYIDRQMKVTAFVNSSTLTVDIKEPLPGSQTHTVGSDPRLIFNLGDTVEGSVSGAKGYVVTLTVNTIGVQLLSAQVASSTGSGFASSPDERSTQISGFVSPDVIVGPGGSITPTVYGATVQVANAVPFWDEEVMNSYRGWPASGFFDQGRLGMCNFPAVPNGISWSAIGSPTDLFVGATTSAAMFELAPNKSQVLYVQPGAEGSEMVFCDNRVYYIPISVSNPLKPGAVAFNQVSSDGCHTVQPRNAGSATIFLAAGGIRVSAIVAIGQTNRPYDVADLTELSSHLFNSPVAIAVPTADGTFSERYAYVLNGDGTLAVGKYTLDENMALKGSVGWVPWSGSGTAKWVSALEEAVIFTGSYAPNGIAAVSVVEQLDDTIYLDGAMFYNAAPAAFTPGLGQGPLYWLAGGTVEVMDQSYRPMGTYTIDANGFLVPQLWGGEDLTVATLICGQTWTATWEPFIPHAPPGQDAQQRVRRRRVAKANINVQQSSGFIFGTRRVPAYFQDDDATLAPPLREGSFQFRPRGRDYDPRKQLVKDTPGPLIIVEAGIEATA